MFHRTHWTAAIAALVIAMPLAAQNVSNVAPVVSAPVAEVVATPAVAPVSLAPIATSAVGVHVAAPALLPSPKPFREGGTRNPAMMIVGGVALLVGAVVGGDSGTIIMIGGGALGLFGLWQYLK